MNSAPLRDLMALLGKNGWTTRVADLRERLAAGAQAGRLAAQRFAAEAAIEKARRGMALTAPESALVDLATRLPALYEGLSVSGQTRLTESIDTALTGESTITPLLHVLNTAGLQAARGFAVSFAGLETGAPYDLLIARDNATAEIACETISAEEGRAVHRTAWTQLIDRVDPDLQTWLAAHPGRYLLKMTLPKGLKAGADNLPELHARITTMLAAARKADYDEAAILRLDPLLLAGAQAADQAPGMMAKLRREFGPEANFAVTETGSSLFIMAARGGAEDEVAGAMRRRLASIAPARLSGSRPGILAMFIDDTDRLEWHALRDQLKLEGEARQFLTHPEARPVIAVTCASRFELVDPAGSELRFRNPMHPDAKSLALAPAVLSTL
jgi:hypothetical protein